MRQGFMAIRTTCNACYGHGTFIKTKCKKCSGIGIESNKVI